ncbi:hypothetical protein K437DRAFT_254628 [Tilletiaria anomala UBC 951]|uniref:Uncharacterized protein n=1 Tax=Tilletiaria anomala (strain ATCC 24038 / CBS 436.72 / UBC 951) TaxID=1037660 RepID=A0A066WM47_TILAU|nr:uncharacterized protein K437DRAFT_254628 [Tilletiaria anomala UBC 951]KDN52074.1 hypothetical protein K437DRAFT_254628 [Tilletiaria anomala UBC 951]
MPHKRRKFSDRQATREFAGNDFAPSSGFDISKEALPKGKMNILNAGKIQAAYRERRKQSEQGASQKKGEASSDPQPSNRLSASGKSKGKAAAVADEKEDPTRMRIREGERLRDFNARVEQAFASTISAAARSASKHAQNQKKRKRRKEGGDGGSDEDSNAGDTDGARQKRKENAQQAEAREKRERDELRAQRESIRHDGEDREFATLSQRKSVRDVVMAPPTLKAGKFSKASAGASADRPGKRIGADMKQEQSKRAQERMLAEERERVIQTYRKKKDDEQKQRLGMKP